MNPRVKVNVGRLFYATRRSADRCGLPIAFCPQRKAPLLISHLPRDEKSAHTWWREWKSFEFSFDSSLRNLHIDHPRMLIFVHWKKIIVFNCKLTSRKPANLKNYLERECEEHYVFNGAPRRIRRTCVAGAAPPWILHARRSRGGGGAWPSNQNSILRVTFVLVARPSFSSARSPFPPLFRPSRAEPSVDNRRAWRVATAARVHTSPRSVLCNREC